MIKFCTIMLILSSSILHATENPEVVVDVKIYQSSAIISGSEYPFKILDNELFEGIVPKKGPYKLNIFIHKGGEVNKDFIKFLKENYVVNTFKTVRKEKKLEAVKIDERLFGSWKLEDGYTAEISDGKIRFYKVENNKDKLIISECLYKFKIIKDVIITTDNLNVRKSYLKDSSGNVLHETEQKETFPVTNFKAKYSIEKNKLFLKYDGNKALQGEKL